MASPEALSVDGQELMAALRRVSARLSGEGIACGILHGEEMALALFGLWWLISGFAWVSAVVFAEMRAAGGHR